MEMLPYNDEPYILLCDNVSFHLNPVNFGDQGEVMYLPVFSFSQHGWNGRLVYQSVFEEGNG